MAYGDHLTSLKKDGYVIIENLFSETFCNQAAQALHQIQDEFQITPMDQDFAGRKTLRIMNLLQYDPIFQEIPVHDGYLPIVREYLDSECLLSGIDSSEIWPGEKAQPLHCDTWWHDDIRLPFPITVNSVLTLCDFTAQNGATRVVPGSHLWSAEQVAYEITEQDTVSHLPASNPHGQGTDWEPIVAEAPKGSIILWDSRLLHGGGANHSDRPRPSIISPFCLGWVRQLDNFAYGIPHEKLRSFTPELQQLVGLDSHRGGYGNVNNMSPREWLWGDRKVHQAA